MAATLSITPDEILDFGAQAFFTSCERTPDREAEFEAYFERIARMLSRTRLSNAFVDGRDQMAHKLELAGARAQEQGESLTDALAFIGDLLGSTRACGGGGGGGGGAA